MNTEKHQINPHNLVGERWIKELEHLIYERLDEKFIPSQKALEELNMGKDDDTSLYHQELADFTVGVMKLLYARVSQEYKQLKK